MIYMLNNLTMAKDFYLQIYFSQNHINLILFSPRDCVFTQGAWINNRSLFPCQEPPGAMATWQATIHAPSGWVALMSGDQEAQITQQQNGKEKLKFRGIINKTFQSVEI